MAICLRLAHSVATGTPLGDRSIRKGRVLYFAGENPDNVMCRWMAMIEGDPVTDDSVVWVDEARRDQLWLERVVSLSLKIRSQTPFLAQRRKRWKTLFQLPKAGGRSRQGAPARAIQSTASTNRRLSWPCRPLSPSLPGTRCSIRRHCWFVKSRRIKIALPSCDLESHSRVRGESPYVNRI
jgi:hypothetical protein